MKFEEAFAKLRESSDYYMSHDSWVKCSKCVGYCIKEGALKEAQINNTTNKVVHISGFHWFSYMTAEEVMSDDWIVREIK